MNFIFLSCASRGNRAATRCACVMVATAAGLFASRTAPAAVTFDQAVAAAATHAPSQRSRVDRVEAARQDAARAGALPDPRLGFGIDNLPVTGRQAFSTSADDMTMKRIGLTQELPARAKRDAEKALAQARVDEALQLASAEALAVRENAASAWLDVWSAEQEMRALAEQRDQLALAGRTARARYGAGVVSAVDAMAIDVARLESDSRIDDARARHASAVASLARWLDVPAPAVDISGAPPALDALPRSERDLLAHIDRLRGLTPWDTRESAANAALSLAIAQRSPDWSIGASYGQREGDRTDMLSVEVSVGLPVFHRDRQDHGIAARRAELAATLDDREDARRMQREALLQALAKWKAAVAQDARLRTRLLPLAHERARVALASYAAGAPLQPWLDARLDETRITVDRARMLGELGRVWAALAYLLPATEASP